MGNQENGYRGGGQGILVSRVPKAAAVEIKRVFKSEGGRYRWWFWVMGEESALK